MAADRVRPHADTQTTYVQSGKWEAFRLEGRKTAPYRFVSTYRGHIQKSSDTETEDCNKRKTCAHKEIKAGSEVEQLYV